MMNDADFFRFPSTPHLSWLGEGEVRGDKVFTAREARTFLSEEVLVEEKIDGANVGISIDPQGRPRAQSRGRYLSPGDHPQFGPLWPWLDARALALREALGEELILFGEWCFARHSIRYDRLPDWFLAFDVYDRNDASYWSSARRDALLEPLAIAPVPALTRGRASLASLIDLVERSPSCVASTVLEGVYLRRESTRSVIARAKLVRREFTQQIEAHWSRRALELNQLALGV